MPCPANILGELLPINLDHSSAPALTLFLSARTVAHSFAIMENTLSI
jgi:hypothetical protein